MPVLLSSSLFVVHFFRDCACFADVGVWCDCVVQHCLEPLEEADALPADALATIFCNVRDLRRHSEDLVAALAPEVETWSEENTRLAQVFFDRVCHTPTHTHPSTQTMEGGGRVHKGKRVCVVCPHPHARTV